MRNTLLLVIILLLAAFLRFWQLGNNPPSLSWDEASWGYNAYTLGLDGRDEFGKFLPIQYLESFGDFKPPLYAYLTILPVKIFGLNEFSTRFASAFFGVLTVAVTYFLVKELFKKSVFSVQYSVFSAFFLAISPWHINLSRAAFEANVASFFIISGVWLFLVAMQNKPRWLIISAISFVLSMYTFNTARIVSPLLVLVLVIGFRGKLMLIKRETIVAGILGLIIFIPLGIFLISPQAKLRFNEVNIFSDLGIIERTNQEIKNDNNAWWSKIIHNRRIAYGQEFLKHYFDHFNPAFLFIKGDGNPKFSTGDVGQLYLWDLPFLILGTLFLFRKREGLWWLLVFWMAVGIIPAATARETPHALRIETTLPVWQIIVAYGVISLISQMRQIKLRKKLAVFLFSLLIFNSVYYLHGYYTHYPLESSAEWQYGYKESIAYIKNVENQYDQVIFTESLGRPYIYFLFYSKMNPLEFRQTAKIWREALGFVHVDSYGKYFFVKDVQAGKTGNKKILFVDTPDQIPPNANIQQTFLLLNGRPALVAYIK